MNYWSIQYNKKQKDCEHKDFIPMTPLEKRSVSVKFARYNLYLTEICSDCGKKRKRKLGVLSEGTN